MMLVRVCDKCGKPVDTDGPFNEDSWISAAIALDESAREGHSKDYHRKCARTVTLAELWAKPNLVDL